MKRTLIRQTNIFSIFSIGKNCLCADIDTSSTRFWCRHPQRPTSQMPGFFLVSNVDRQATSGSHKHLSRRWRYGMESRVDSQQRTVLPPTFGFKRICRLHSSLQNLSANLTHLGPRCPHALYRSCSSMVLQAEHPAGLLFNNPSARSTGDGNPGDCTLPCYIATPITLVSCISSISKT